MVVLLSETGAAPATSEIIIRKTEVKAAIKDLLFRFRLTRNNAHFGGSQFVGFLLRNSNRRFDNFGRTQAARISRENHRKLRICARAKCATIWAIIRTSAMCKLRQLMEKNCGIKRAERPANRFIARSSNARTRSMAANSTFKLHHLARVAFIVESAQKYFRARNVRDAA